MINPRCACAARVAAANLFTIVTNHYGIISLSSSFFFSCQLSCKPRAISQSASNLTSPAINRSTNNTTYSTSNKGQNMCRVFSETAVFGSYCMKHERKSQYANRTGLPRAGPLVLCILKTQEVTTKGVYRLPHTICCCMSDSPRAIY